MTHTQLLVALNAIDFVALFVVIGLLICRAFLLPLAVFSQVRVSSAWHKTMLVSLAVMSLCGICNGVVRIMLLADVSLVSAVEFIPQYILQSHLGMVWAAHILLLALSWCVLLVSRNILRAWPAYLLLFIFTLLAMTYTGSSHAAEQGDFTWIELNDWIHLLASTIWGGGIIATVYFLLPNRFQFVQVQKSFAQVIQRLSRLFLVSVPLVFITGTLNLYAHVSDISEMLANRYGQVLTVKLILFTLMSVIGLYNFSVVSSKQFSSESIHEVALSKLLRTFKLDNVLLVAVLMCVAILVETMPF